MYVCHEVCAVQQCEKKRSRIKTENKTTHDSNEANESVASRMAAGVLIFQNMQQALKLTFW